MEVVPLPGGSLKQYVIAALYHVVSGTLVAMAVWSLVTKPENASAKLQDMAEANARVEVRLKNLERSIADVAAVRQEVAAMRSDVAYIRGRLDAALAESK